MTAIKLTGDANVTGKDTYEFRMAQTLSGLAIGLEQLSMGLRATYALLEDVSAKVDRLSHGRPRNRSRRFLEASSRSP